MKAKAKKRQKPAFLFWGTVDLSGWPKDFWEQMDKADEEIERKRKERMKISGYEKQKQSMWMAEAMSRHKPTEKVRTFKVGDRNLTAVELWEARFPYVDSVKIKFFDFQNAQPSWLEARARELESWEKAVTDAYKTPEMQLVLNQKTNGKKIRKAQQSNVLTGPLGGVAAPTYGNISGSAGMYFNSSSTTDFTAGGVGQFEVSATAISLRPSLCDYLVGNNCLTFAPGLISVTGAGNAILHSPNNTKNVGTSDFTDASSAALQAITGLSFPLGSTAQVFSFHCALMYSQATAVAGDQFGVGVITTAPTSVNVAGRAYTSTGAASAESTGTLNGLATTTPTAVVTFTPAVNATIYNAYLDGTIETAGGGAATFNVYVLNGTAANVIVVKRGSYCVLY